MTSTREALPHDRCPTCQLNWSLSPPAKIDKDDAVRCVGCKAVYPLAAPGEPIAMLGGIHGVTLMYHIKQMRPEAQKEYHTPLYTTPQPSLLKSELSPAPSPVGADDVHTMHCDQGEYVGLCKYGDADCTALARPSATADAVRLREALPTDVVRLVIAARIVAFESQDAVALKELDEASEAFSDLVPWDDEPENDDVDISSDVSSGHARDLVGGRLFPDGPLALSPQAEAGSERTGETITVPFNPCLAKLREGEPFFVLLGRDKQAPNAVLTWANDRETAEGKLAWTDQAREVAHAMAVYSGHTETTKSEGGVEGHAAVPLETPTQRSGESHDPLGDGSVKVGPHREDAAGIKSGPSDTNPSAEGGSVEADPKVALLLRMVEAAGGEIDATDDSSSLLNYFCNDRGRVTDTFNLAIESGYLRTSFNDIVETSRAFLTDAGRAFLRTRQGGQPAAADDAAVATVTYTNYRGITTERRIVPKSVRYGSTEWHPVPQWLLLAWDDDKQADREFALKDFGTPPARAADVEVHHLRIALSTIHTLARSAGLKPKTMMVIEDTASRALSRTVPVARLAERREVVARIIDPKAYKTLEEHVAACRGHGMTEDQIKQTFGYRAPDPCIRRQADR